MTQFLRYVGLPAAVGGLVGVLVLYLNEPAAPADDGPGFASAVARATPSVVNIYTSKLVRTRVHPICELPRFADLCRSFTGGRRHLQSSLGSGVVVREDGYILTNNHVIAGADEILVAFANGQTAVASVVGSDPETDLAVLSVNAEDLTAISVSPSESAQVGDVALAIGNPFGFGQTVSMGIISAKGRYGISPSPYEDFIQTDAAINPGNSGGALIDADGRLIGINTMIFSRTGGYQGIGFAIPAGLALSVLEEIVAQGHVIRGWLGIEVRSNPSAGAAVGLLVANVLPGSPAAAAGIESGDVILAINDQPAVSARAVTRQIAMADPGTRIKLDILRQGEQLTVEATAGERPSTG